MKRLFLACLVLALAACAKPAAERPKLARAGQPAPELRLPKLLNAPFLSLAGWQDLKGKAVVLEFWATWCEPCVDNIPHLNELAEKFRDRPVVFISVTDESEAAVLAFLKERKLAGWVAPEAGPEAFKAFRVYGRPHTVLIGKDGNVKTFTYPSEVTPEKIEELLAGRLRPSPGKDAGLHAAEDAGPDPSVLAEFHLARSSGTPSVKYQHEFFSARALTLRMAFDFVLGAADRLDLGPGVAEVMDASYDIRLVAPSRAEDRKKDLFLKGINFALGLRVTQEVREEEVYVLKKVPGVPQGARRTKDFSGVSFDGVSLKTAGSSFLVLAGYLGEKLGRPVLDETREEGPLEYSFTFETRDPKVLDAQLRRGLGLRLDRLKRKIKVLTVRKP
ncbi:MAG: hypothetical protein A2X35_12930 [Elusimicrobia bacterium GWA2_61_42]|nr:MAG: hypothetical protein A2X35_12930 [Elusimicrobia bacterium GWA2_61_42]OGR77445.1 MAG: hypothetical protein A2X38_10200 [Elusimicrobia bacterium GWC2_61_25]